MSIQPIPLQKLKHPKSKQDEQLVINCKNFNRYMLGPTASSRRWHSVEVGWERQSTGAAQHPPLHRFRNKHRRPKNSQITSPKMTIFKQKHGKHGRIDFIDFDMDGRLKIPKDQASMFFRGVKRVVGPSELRKALGLRPQRKGKPERNAAAKCWICCEFRVKFFVLVMTFVFKHLLLCAVGPCSSSSAVT